MSYVRDLKLVEKLIVELDKEIEELNNLIVDKIELRKQLDFAVSAGRDEMKREQEEGLRDEADTTDCDVWDLIKHWT